MQIKKNNIRELVLEVARKEFLTCGFKGASMRIIASKSGVGLSNIYNYYSNKDEILKEVLKPLLIMLNNITTEHNKAEYISTDVFSSEKYRNGHIDLFLGLIKLYKKELNLLLFNSHGSSLENFKIDYVDKHTKVGFEYLAMMKEKYPHINVNISNFFIRTMSSWWITIIGEIVSHDLSDKEVEQFIVEYMTFGSAGWEKIMKV